MFAFMSAIFHQSGWPHKRYHVITAQKAKAVELIVLVQSFDRGAVAAEPLVMSNLGFSFLICFIRIISYQLRLSCSKRGAGFFQC